MQHIKKILPLAALALLTLLTSSCGGLRHIRVEDVRNVSLQPAAGGKMQLGMEAKVSNPSCYKVQVEQLTLNVELRGAAFATITTSDKLVIARHSSDFLPIALELRLRNMLAAAIALQKKKLSADELTVEGELKVKSFLLRKTIKIEKQSLRAFSAQFGDFVTPLLSLQNP
jgi:LEA14-like dessication related protein